MKLVRTAALALTAGILSLGIVGATASAAPADTSWGYGSTDW